MGNGGDGTTNRNTGFIQVLNGSLLVWDAAGPLNTNHATISGVGALVVTDAPPVNSGIIDLVDPNDPADPNSPTVVDVRRFPSALTVTFFSPAAMKRSTVLNPASYVVRSSGGDRVVDARLQVSSAGTYSFQPPPLPDGVHTAWVRFKPAGALADVAALDFTVDSAGPRLLPSSGALAVPFDSLGLHFSEPIDASTFTTDDVTLQLSDGTVVPITGLTGSGTDFT